jgi:hypothetical protein
VVRGMIAGRHSIRLLDRERRWVTQQLGDLLMRMRSIKAMPEFLPHALISPSNRRAPTDPRARRPAIDARATLTSCGVIAADSADVAVVSADAPCWTRVPRPATPTTVPAGVGPSSARRMVTNETSYCLARSRLDRSRRSGFGRLSIERASSSAMCPYLGREKQ